MFRRVLTNRPLRFLLSPAYYSFTRPFPEWTKVCVNNRIQLDKKMYVVLVLPLLP